MISQFINFVRRLTAASQAHPEEPLPPMSDDVPGNGIPLPENDFGLQIMNRTPSTSFTSDSCAWGDAPGAGE